jgi:hypothetical protein
MRRAAPAQTRRVQRERPGPSLHQLIERAVERGAQAQEESLTLAARHDAIAHSIRETVDEVHRQRRARASQRGPERS